MKNIIYPRQFNQLVKLGHIKSDYLINVDISNEKDKLIRENEKLLENLKAWKNETLILREKIKKYEPTKDLP